MNLLVARTAIQSKPSKRLIEMTAYEAVVMLLVAAALVFTL